MRNSTYQLGLDYRKKAFWRRNFLPDIMMIKTHYESVKMYVEVKPKNIHGFTMFFYNEYSTSTSKKKRVRNGLGKPVLIYVLALPKKTRT